MSDTVTAGERRRAVLVRGLVVLAGVVVLAVSFTVLFSDASTAVRWLAGAVAAAAVLATVAAAVRLFVALSHFLEPADGRPGNRNGAGP